MAGTEIDKSQEQQANPEISPLWVYIIYLVSLVTAFPALVGLIMAYIFRGNAPDWQKSHYTFQIRTFWIGLLYILIGCLALIPFVLPGLAIFLFVLLWFVIRIVKGLQAYNAAKPIEDVATWMF